MHIKVKGSQTLWVLLIALVLIAFCIGGLWAYVKSADAQTGVQEASVTALPEAEKITITWEKYDNYPAPGKEEDMENKFIGIGLTRAEKERLPALIEAYAGGQKPLSPAKSISGMGDISIIPLDPNDYAGMTEYYLLPGHALDDEQLLQLIDYSAGKGDTFSADMLTSKNCSRGGNVFTNRYLSAGEFERMKILAKRAYTEGLFQSTPKLSIESLPAKGPSCVVRYYETPNSCNFFYFYPIREMTDTELLQAISLDTSEGYTTLNPAEDESLNSVKDAAGIRSILEEFSGMPMAAEINQLIYRRRDDTGETRLQANFYSARINGKSTRYSVIVDQKTGQYLTISQQTTAQAQEIVDQSIQAEKTGAFLSESECVAIARSLVEKACSTKIRSAHATGLLNITQDALTIILEHVMNVQVKLEDGNEYAVNVRLSDGAVIELSYQSMGESDSFQWN